MSFVSRRGHSRTRRPPHLGIAFHHAPAFRVGTTAIAIGVVLHLPTFFSAAMGYRLVGMPMSNEMLAGMALIVQRAGLRA
jgi:hypothetical protein